MTSGGDIAAARERAPGGVESGTANVTKAVMVTGYDHTTGVVRRPKISTAGPEVDVTLDPVPETEIVE